MSRAARTAPIALLLLAACADTKIQFPDPDADDTAAVDTADTGDTAPTDTDTAPDTDTDIPPEEDPYTGEVPTDEASALLLASSGGDGVGNPNTIALVGEVGAPGHLLASARGASTPAGNAAGVVYLLDAPPSGTHDLDDLAATRFLGDRQGGMFGTAVVGAGDLDGDGHADVAISAAGVDGGTVSIFRGPFADGDRSPSDAATTLVGEADFSYTGQALQRAGDVDADGFDDLAIVSMFNDDPECAGCGTVYVSMSAHVEGTGLVSNDAVRITGDRGHGSVTSVAQGADYDGDGFVDIAVGAPGTAQGGAAVLYGPFRSGSFELGDADVWFGGATNGGYAGSSLTGTDLDGDGYDDLAVGAPYVAVDGTGYAGAVYVHAGRAGRWAGEVPLADGATLAGEVGDYAGSTVAAAGDVDGDGRNDLLVSAPYGGGTTYSGRAYLAYGPVAGGTSNLTEAGATFLGTFRYGYAGYGLAGGGDVDGDGAPDIALGALVAAEQGRGGVYLFAGR